MEVVSLVGVPETDALSPLGSLWDVWSLVDLFPTHHLRGLPLQTGGVWIFSQDGYQHPRSDQLSLVPRAIPW